MTKLTVGQVRDQFADALNQVAYRGERIAIERRGKTVAAVVPIADLELLEALENRIDLEAARAALASMETEGTDTWESVKAELKL
jgi:prevent-host-death family protein